MEKDKNKDTLLHEMEEKNIKITAVDYQNGTFTCDDGNEYPLMDGCETLSIEELQEHLNNAKDVVCELLRKNKQ
jgi:hypothetical protein